MVLAVWCAHLLKLIIIQFICKEDYSVSSWTMVSFVRAYTTMSGIRNKERKIVSSSSSAVLFLLFIVILRCDCANATIAFINVLSAFQSSNRWQIQTKQITLVLIVRPLLNHGTYIYSVLIIIVIGI